MARKRETPCCDPKPELTARPLLTPRQAAGLEATFKVLGNATRLRMLHVLVRSGELCVGDIAEAVSMKHQAVSNQLQRLSDRGILEARREGLQVYYRIVDPCVVSLLDRAWCLAEDSKARRAAWRVPVGFEQEGASA